MKTAAESSKALRGIKRVCLACNVRFYDLRRAPIVCPACGAEYTPVAAPPFAVGNRAAPFTSKTGWRSKSVRPIEDGATQLAADSSPQSATAKPPAGDTEAGGDAGHQDDMVLEQEPDEPDVTGLIDHEVEESRDR